MSRAKNVKPRVGRPKLSEEEKAKRKAEREAKKKGLPKPEDAVKEKAVSAKAIIESEPFKSLPYIQMLSQQAVSLPANYQNIWVIPEAEQKRMALVTDAMAEKYDFGIGDFAVDVAFGAMLLGSVFPRLAATYHFLTRPSMEKKVEKMEKEEREKFDPFNGAKAAKEV